MNRPPASLTMNAVGTAAFDMIKEIRRQFKEIPGLLEGKAEPDTVRCVDIATRAALIRMLPPGLLAVLAPVFVGFGLGAEALGHVAGVGFQAGLGQAHDVVVGHGFSAP